MIQEIYPGGPAEKSAKLKVGDKIIKLNDVDFTRVTHIEAIEAIRGASDKVNTGLFQCLNVNLALWDCSLMQCLFSR